MMPYSYNTSMGIFYMHKYINMITHGRPLVNQSLALVGQIDNMLIEFHISETYGSCPARTRTPRVTDGDSNHHSISLLPAKLANDGQTEVIADIDVQVTPLARGIPRHDVITKA